MSQTGPDARSLRGDLGGGITKIGARDQHLVIDEVGGRFARVSGQVWALLQRGEGDAAIWNEAESAGWTRSRVKPSRRSFSPLAIRIPLGSIDRVAVWLAPRTDWLFSPIAVVSWGLLIGVAGLIALSQHAQWMQSLQRLPIYFNEVHPIHLIAVFAVTKAVHELSHAVVCRRVGARCGDMGVLVLCGVPCPYCDVTDVWRVPQASSRCLVMLAGIYCEWVIASLALFTWMISQDPAWQLMSVYVMLVCGVSTLVFNANPLMRYDGYHVLSDIVGSTNLRAEAKDAWSQIIGRWLRGSGDERYSPDKRACLMAVYHLAATAYGYVVLVAIASLVIAFADRFYLRPLALLLVACLGCRMMLRSAGRIIAMIAGRGPWKESSSWRRYGITSVACAATTAVLFLPTPRYRSVSGRIEPADAVTVYVQSGGVIQSVDAEYGDEVQLGSPLASISLPDASLETVRREGLLRLASLRRQASERKALDQPEAARQWEILRATETATFESVRSAREREQQGELSATAGGLVLPADASQPTAVRALAATDANGSLGAGSKVAERLSKLIGLGAESDGVWCRISPQRERCVVLAIDSQDRDQIREGTPVSVHEVVLGDVVHASRIASLSPIARDHRSVTERATYRATCLLPKVDDAAFLRSIGSRCEAVIRLPSRTLARDLYYLLEVWLGG